MRVTHAEQPPHPPPTPHHKARTTSQGAESRDHANRETVGKVIIGWGDTPQVRVAGGDLTGSGSSRPRGGSDRAAFPGRNHGDLRAGSTQNTCAARRGACAGRGSRRLHRRGARARRRNAKSWAGYQTVVSQLHRASKASNLRDPGTLWRRRRRRDRFGRALVPSGNRRRNGRLAARPPGAPHEPGLRKSPADHRSRTSVISSISCVRRSASCSAIPRPRAAAGR